MAAAVASTRGYHSGGEIIASIRQVALEMSLSEVDEDNEDSGIYSLWIMSVHVTQEGHSLTDDQEGVRRTRY